MCMQCRSDTGHCRNAYSYTKTNMRRNVRKSPDHRCSEHTEWSWRASGVHKEGMAIHFRRLYLILCRINRSLLLLVFVTTVRFLLVCWTVFQCL